MPQAVVQTADSVRVDHRLTLDTRPRELLSEFVDATHRRYRCELLDGVETYITTDDSGYFAARRCASREQAEQWAQQRRRTLDGRASL